MIFIPSSIAFGWFYTKRSKAFGAEMALMVEVNPLTVHSNRVVMEQQMDMLKALKVEPSQEYITLTKYWKKLDEEERWRPS